MIRAVRSRRRVVTLAALLAGVLVGGGAAAGAAAGHPTAAVGSTVGSALAPAGSAPWTSPVTWVDPPESREGEVTFSATLAGRDIGEANENAPLKVRPASGTTIALEIHNGSAAAVQVHGVMFSGRVLSFTLFSYLTWIDRKVEPRATIRSVIEVDLGDLGSQATGLVPASMSLVAPDRTRLAAVTFPVLVAGSLRSTYAALAGFVAAVTALLLAAALTRLLAGTLPEPRWSRAAQFAVPGLGVGLTMALSLSTVGVLTPYGSVGTAFVLVTGLAGAVAGFITPAPEAAAQQPQPVLTAAEV